MQTMEKASDTRKNLVPKTPLVRVEGFQEKHQIANLNGILDRAEQWTGVKMTACILFPFCSFIYDFSRNKAPGISVLLIALEDTG